VLLDPVRQVHPRHRVARRRKGRKGEDALRGRLADPSKVAFRSVWKRLDDERFEVLREQPAGEGWNTVLTVTYKRVPK
jgi:hypothetical protein